MRKKKGFMYAAFLFLVLAAVACTCGPLQQAQETAATAAAAATSINEALPTLQAAATEFGPTVEAGLTNFPTFEAEMTAMIQTADASGIDPASIAATATAIAGGGQTQPDTDGRQWAASATASSQYGPDSWSASQATGAPNTPTCVDSGTAWASGLSNEVATLTLTYSTPVIPTQINIYETYNPDGVSLVEVIDANGTATQVYSAIPSQRTDVTACPFILTIDITTVTTPITQIRITVDQTTFTSWNEIDAVELVGTP